MRILIKILLFPVWLVLTLLLLSIKILCSIGTTILSVLSILSVIIGVIAMTIQGMVPFGILFFIIAFLISPYGIPLIINVLMELVTELKNHILIF